MGSEMNCKIVEKNIAAFLSEELEGKDLKCFVDHIETCPECKEELTIQFLVTAGMEYLEEGNTFDLKSELEDKMDLAKSKIKLNRITKLAALLFECVVVIVVFILIFMMFF